MDINTIATTVMDFLVKILGFFKQIIMNVSPTMYLLILLIISLVAAHFLRKMFIDNVVAKLLQYIILTIILFILLYNLPIGGG